MDAVAIPRPLAAGAGAPRRLPSGAGDATPTALYVAGRPDPTAAVEAGRERSRPPQPRGGAAVEATREVETLSHVSTDSE